MTFNYFIWMLITKLSRWCHRWNGSSYSMIEVNSKLNSPKAVYEIVKNYGKDHADLGEL